MTVPIQVPIYLIVWYCIVLLASWIGLVFFAFERSKYRYRWISVLVKYNALVIFRDVLERYIQTPTAEINAKKTVHHIFDIDRSEPVVTDALGKPITKKP